MSPKETTEQLGRHDAAEYSTGKLSKLAALARQSHDQKRTKDCLDLTRAMLLIDPDNADALWMRSSIQSQMQRDLENARALLQDANSKEIPETRLNLIPVSEARHQPNSEGGDGETLVNEKLRLAVAYASGSRRARMGWVKPASVLIILGVTAIAVASFRPDPVQTPPRTVTPSNTSSLAANANPVQSDLPLLALSGKQAPPLASGPVDPSIPALTEDRLTDDRFAPLGSPTTARVPRPTPDSPDPAVVAAASGTLAISSPTTVDIYKADVYVGSAPVSLALPAGPQTLEYRHGNLRQTVTHFISSNETTRAMVTFDVTIRINSKPWAEVFQEGVERKDLGQTPLSGVSVPIGSVLVFQNQQFQPKKYRVTGNETGIQNVFQ